MTCIRICICICICRGRCICRCTLPGESSNEVGTSELDAYVSKCPEGNTTKLKHVTRLSRKAVQFW